MCGSCHLDRLLNVEIGAGNFLTFYYCQAGVSTRNGKKSINTQQMQYPNPNRPLNDFFFFFFNVPLKFILGHLQDLEKVAKDAQRFFFSFFLKWQKTKKVNKYLKFVSYRNDMIHTFGSNMHSM